ncbi:hypothetical protein TIFTF001_023166 [Ficus carica]|uniref:Uncharacterized protein n=1 Tax=Ficus carica TaxID=3494 RepID=A0AA88DK48_FICCA|nr:hypothetical protein TIFTF001_023166 [Ficus carica]
MICCFRSRPTKLNPSHRAATNPRQSGPHHIFLSSSSFRARQPHAPIRARVPLSHVSSRAPSPLCMGPALLQADVSLPTSPNLYVTCGMWVHPCSH